jgi:hypothetical protein
MKSCVGDLEEMVLRKGEFRKVDAVTVIPYLGELISYL